MGDIGIPELLIVLAIVIILFGPSRLIGAGRALGDVIRQLRQSLRDGDSSVPTHDEQQR